MITIPYGTGIDEQVIRSCIKTFVCERLPILKRLDAYYSGGAPISSRVKPNGAPNNKLAHPFARYIVTMASGYLLGGPIAYVDDEQLCALTSLMRSYKEANVESVDCELSEQASLFGVGVELLYVDESASVRMSTLNPMNAFTVYDDSAEHRPVLGINMRVNNSPDDTKSGCDRYAATIYTASETFEMSGMNQFDLRIVSESRAHYFPGVPIVEYWNNARERSDVEPILSLIDAYDTLQSDRVNDKQQFAESLLVFTGVSGFAPSDEQGDKRPIGRRLREDQAIALPDRDAHVEWLTKRLNEADAQVLADSIRQDLHKLAMVPDMADSQFAGNVSGIAMRYKLLGFDQMTRVKERWFREGLRSRMRLASRVLEMKGEPALDPERVQIIFNRSRPINDLEEAQSVSALRGLVPDELLLGRLSFIEDSKAAIDMKKMTEQVAPDGSPLNKKQL